jgi:heme/copper-type cytochrome/quinol oxidase subunit 2
MNTWKWLIVPAAVGLGLLLAGASLAAPAGQAPVVREFALRADQYRYSPYALRVNVGDQVRLTLVSARDVAHGLYLDGYAVSVTSWDGQPATVTFVADRPGKFRFRCSEACGPLHPFMIGELIVAPNTPYRAAVVLALLTALGTLAYRWRKERG